MCYFLALSVHLQYSSFTLHVAGNRFSSSSLSLKPCLSACGQMVFYVTPMGDERILGEHWDELWKAARHSLSLLSQTAVCLILDVAWQLVCSRPKPVQAGSTPGWCSAQYVELSLFTLQCKSSSFSFIVLTVFSTGFQPSRKHRVHPALSFLAWKCTSCVLLNCSGVKRLFGHGESDILWMFYHSHW